MIGLDTNVLVRYLTQDDVAQVRKADALITEAVTAGGCYVGSVVLCELVWVLRDAYQLDKATVVGTLDRILTTAQFHVGGKDLVRRALEDYRDGSGDFADYVIGRSSQEAGCSTTATFDRALRQHSAFRWLG